MQMAKRLQMTQLDRGEKVDVFPEYQYEVGITPEYAIRLKDETPNFHSFSVENQPVTTSPALPDSKYRYLWNIGKVTEDIPPNHIPDDFPDFEGTMNDWGDHLYRAVVTVSQMVALGFQLDRDVLSSRLEGGHNKLAPKSDGGGSASLANFLHDVYSFQERRPARAPAWVPQRGEFEGVPSYPYG
ncbi:unnamed protein product [Sphagnum balticum]